MTNFAIRGEGLRTEQDGRNEANRSLVVDRPLFQIGDIVLTDEGRVGVYYGDGAGTYGTVVFLDDHQPNNEGIPWSALSAPSGLWRCWCPGGRFWNVATAPVIRCDKCGATRA